MKTLYRKYFERIRTRVFLPSIELRPYIIQYMIYENASIHLRDIPFRALPNGYVELFFHLNGSHVHFHEKRSITRRKCFLAGIFELTYPLKIKVTTTNECFNGLSTTFTPKGVNKLLGVALFELTNRIIDVESFWREEGNRLIQRIIYAKTDEERVQILNEFFMFKLYDEKDVNQKDIQWILDLLEEKTGKITVDEMAHHLDLSYKTLYRKFHVNMGLRPKTYFKIFRFNRACRLLNQYPDIDWGELVYRCGYYDQPHFINEFHTIMKESPTQFIKTTGGNFYLNRPYCFR
ncbi:MAG: helix-turn-helix transcriptional regulator [Bacteroidales bacterium]|nr:helix-turn-helix transcriptional regulator [Bacteroidales bacterium]